eukprot:9154538-Prorocentrum_lima.AAC.1
MVSCSSPFVSFTNQIRRRTSSAGSVPDTKAASFRFAVVLCKAGGMSSGEGSWSKTPLGPSQSYNGGGGAIA